MRPRRRGIKKRILSHISGFPGRGLWVPAGPNNPQSQCPHPQAWLWAPGWGCSHSEEARVHSLYLILLRTSGHGLALPTKLPALKSTVRMDEMRKPKALEDGDCDQCWCGLGASPFSGLLPASPGDLQRCQLRQRELCGGPGRHVWVCVSKAVYWGVPLCGTVSPGQFCVSVCLAVNLSVGLGSLA